MSIFYYIVISLFTSYNCVNIVHNKTDYVDSLKYKKDNDSIIIHSLKEVVVYPSKIKDKIRTKNNTKKIPRRYRQGTRAYKRTVRNLKKTYPLAKQAAIKIRAIEEKLKKIISQKERKKFLKKEYSKLMKEYKKPMMKLYISQGRMLMVLIDRETGHTSYEHIKEFKGGFTAFFWQGIARLFGQNLKKPYDPKGEHRHLEELIQKYERGEL